MPKMNLSSWSDTEAEFARYERMRQSARVTTPVKLWERGPLACRDYHAQCDDPEECTYRKRVERRRK